MVNPNTNVSKSISFKLDVFIKLTQMAGDSQPISIVVNNLLENQFKAIEAAKKEENKNEI